MPRLFKSVFFVVTVIVKFLKFQKCTENKTRTRIYNIIIIKQLRQKKLEKQE